MPPLLPTAFDYVRMLEGFPVQTVVFPDDYASDVRPFPPTAVFCSYLEALCRLASTSFCPWKIKSLRIRRCVGSEAVCFLLV